MKDPSMQKRVRLFLQVNSLPVCRALVTLASLRKMMICLLSRGILFFQRGSRDFSTGVCSYCGFSHCPYSWFTRRSSRRKWGREIFGNFLALLVIHRLLACSALGQYWEGSACNSKYQKSVMVWNSPHLEGLGGEKNSIYCGVSASPFR